MAAPSPAKATPAAAATSAPTVRYAKAAKWTPGFAEDARIAEEGVGHEKSFWRKARENLGGLNFRTQLIDSLAPVEAVAFGHMESLKALQTMSYLRMYGQRMHFTAQAIANGVMHLVKKTRKDGRDEWLVESKEGVNIKDIVDILADKELAKIVGSPDAVNLHFTMYLAALRAKRVGIDVLNFSKKITEEDLAAVIKKVESTPELKKAYGKARDKYNQYNRDLLNFAVETGALSQKTIDELLKTNDYIPYYRVTHGVAELMIGGETPVRIGNIKDQPYLRELVGGNDKILPFFTGAMQRFVQLRVRAAGEKQANT
jgi:hypothetical protein